MSLAQLGQVIWSGRWRLLLCTLACLAGALAVSLRLPKAYEAKARVILELVQPDLVTGITYERKAMETYVRTQQLLVMSQRVAEAVVDKLGWTSNPQVIEAWQQQTGGTGDMRAWTADRLSKAVGAYPLEGGGTLEIIYRAPDPDAAETITRFLREAYIETTLALQTEAAARRAARLAAQLPPARAKLATAQATLTRLQRESGTVMLMSKDVEAPVLGRLQDQLLAAERGQLLGTDGERPANYLASAQLRRNLSDVEQRLAIAGTTLGADNPLYRRLLMQRAELLRQTARSAAEARSAAGAASAANSRIAAAREAAYFAERARILAKGDTYIKLVQAERQVDLRLADLKRLEANYALTRESSQRSESGLVVMGDVIVNPEPVFPNIPLNALLATLFGLGLGLSSVLIDGLWRREVHGSADLAGAAGVPVLAVVPGVEVAKQAWWHRWRQLLPRRRRGPVAA